jgi:hypothetical protein
MQGRGGNLGILGFRVGKLLFLDDWLVTFSSDQTPNPETTNPDFLFHRNAYF